MNKIEWLSWYYLLYWEHDTHRLRHIWCLQTKYESTKVGYVKKLAKEIDYEMLSIKRKFEGIKLGIYDY